MATGPLPSSESLAEQCQTPRAADTVDPLTGDLYGDTQGSLTTEKQWIRSYVNETYLWYADVASVDPTPYVVGATVPFVNPSDNSAGSEFLATNYEVVDAYFNSQRSPFFTASGKPKDQFHFTFVTTDWVALSSAGSTAGFGFTAAVLVASPPRDVRIAYTDPGTPAATATPALVRGLQFVTINNVDVANGSDVATLNEALFAPIMGKQYVFVYTDLQGAPGNRTTFTAVAGTVTSTPVQNVGTLPAPNASVGYMLFNAQIAPAEGELIAGISTLQAANGGAGITDLVLDLRYNGGGFLDIASELAFMIAGPTPTAGKAFEVERFNNKNPFGVTTAQATTGFHNVSQGFSTTAGAALPHLDLARVFVLTGPDTCSASEAVINGLRGVGIEVIQIGHTTCGKPYGFFPQDNCDTTYFAIQFQGANAAGFSGFADGFVPAGGTAGNDLPGCQVADDLTRQLGDPAEGRLAAALLYRNNSGMCPAVSVSKPNPLGLAPQHEAAMLHRSAILENKFLLRKRFGQ
jgi:carboxyl-terminal processing protease